MVILRDKTSDEVAEYLGLDRRSVTRSALTGRNIGSIYKVAKSGNEVVIAPIIVSRVASLSPKIAEDWDRTCKIGRLIKEGKAHIEIDRKGRRYTKLHKGVVL